MIACAYDWGYCLFSVRILFGFFKLLSLGINFVFIRERMVKLIVLDSCVVLYVVVAIFKYF